MEEIKHVNGDKNGHFSLYIDDKEAGLMSYVWVSKQRFIIDHTEVKPGYEGHGYGKLLVKAGVEFARKEGVKIIPLCPYAKAVIDRTPEYHDVLDA
ncbi:MAG: GNAT family N-acetyltransferase [Porphyromonas sp.]|nr:GNAT family N-acetyltransferase [Porphyromonas sp.]